jgi:hypothetical protein
MKEVVKSFNTAMLDRIKNPLIGTFLLSWVAWNNKGIAVFLLGDNDAKKVIVEQFNLWDLSELMGVLVTVCGYIVLTQFGLPLLQNFIDKLKLNVVDIKCFEQRTALSNANTEEEIKANTLKYKSQMEYIGKVAEKELLAWEEQKAELNKKITVQANSLLGSEATLKDVYSDHEKEKKEHLTKLEELTNKMFLQREELTVAGSADLDHCKLRYDKKLDDAEKYHLLSMDKNEEMTEKRISSLYKKLDMVEAELLKANDKVKDHVQLESNLVQTYARLNERALELSVLKEEKINILKIIVSGDDNEKMIQWAEYILKHYEEEQQIKDEMFTNKHFEEQQIKDEMFTNKHFEEQQIKDEMFTNKHFEEQQIKDEMLANKHFEEQQIKDEMLANKHFEEQ